MGCDWTQTMRESILDPTKETPKSKAKLQTERLVHLRKKLRDISEEMFKVSNNIGNHDDDCADAIAHLADALSMMTTGNGIGVDDAANKCKLVRFNDKVPQGGLDGIIRELRKQEILPTVDEESV